MKSRTEKDYDSATPALQQQMNLARRACWPRPTTAFATATSHPSPSPSPVSTLNYCAYPSNGAKQIQLNELTTCQLANPMSRNQSDGNSSRSQQPQQQQPPPPSEQPPTRVYHKPRHQQSRSMSLLLLLLCSFCLLLAGSEARPNVSASSSSSSSSSSSTAQPPAAVTQLNLPQTTTPSVLATTDAASSTMPPQQPVAEELKDPDPFDVEMDDEEGGHHKMERYPLSQVDFARVKTPFIIGIWILSASIAKIGFHMTPKLHLIFPESCLLIVVGVVIGVVLYFCTDVAVSPLTPNTFFFYMLPPIILDAGYFMPNRMFFDNLGTILLMAVVGTIFNVATIGGSLYACGVCGIFGDETPKLLDVFLFASLISAVDPVAVLAVFEEIHVNEILYIVVFGESLLNDAVTVVMYHMMESYNEIGLPKINGQDIAYGVGSFFVVALGGTAIGIIWGFLTGLVTRFTDHVRVIEPIFIFVMAYLAYLNAEIFHMSGILAITFCGITMKNYVESNISQKSHTTVKYALKMLSSSAETIIFMFLGVATVNNMHVWNTWFVVLTIAFCSVFRVIGVILLSAIANRFRLHKLSRVDQFVMSYGGLRGAVAFALVLLVDERVVKHKNMFVTTTIAVIYFTVFLQGITIKPLVKILNVKRANKRKPTMNERIHERFMDHLMAGIEDIVGKTGNYNVRDKFKRFDNRFIRPLLIRDLKGAEPKIIETYSKLTMRDAMEVMRRNPSTIGQMTGTESMSALFRNYTNNYIGGRWAPPTIYTTCPSLTNLDNTCSHNLDMAELDYNPSKKDLTDARIHHLLAEELKPYRRASIQMHRRLSYSRHAVDDRDLSTQVNYKMQMNFRRMFNDRKHHKRSKRGASNKEPKENVKQNHVSFTDFQQNGTAKQLSNADENQQNPNEINVIGPNDDWDDGLTFTAKSSPDSDRANNNSLIAHIQNLPGFDASKARIVQHYAPKLEDGPQQELDSPDPPVGPTAAELILPWRRDRSYQSIVAEHPIPEEDRNLSRDSDGERRVATPTATESQLPWKRQGDECTDAVQQNEFPAWASNKEYLAYNSPSATFLGGINKPKQPKSVIGLFRRESSSSKAGSLGSVDPNLEPSSTTATMINNAGGSTAPSTSMMHNPRLDNRSQSISSGTLGSHLVGPDGHTGPFPVTASHRRNVRRGSMLELSGLIVTGRRPSRILLCSPGANNLLENTPTTTATTTARITTTTTSATTRTSTTNNTNSTANKLSITPTTTTTTPTTITSTSNSTTTPTTIAEITTSSNNSPSNSSTTNYSSPTSESSGATYYSNDTIPEESSYQHGHSKSLCEPADGDDWEGVPLATTAGVGVGGVAASKSERQMHSGREPLLPRLTSTPRAQIRHMNAGAVGGATVGVPGCKNQVTTALLDYEDTESESEDEDDDDDEGEDFDLYDDENIVVTTFTTPQDLTRRGGAAGGGGGGGGGTTTTTSIRLTRNNDESII
ncbi:sodium/hydrogen exchanger 3 isoform X3 [Drosophila nasuta]|uniref:sodium/hydrogen exchanger 3 isoform X3 n=1 Tax=Drosophila nasuta TaxID=42062 RepID=UPI00295E7B8D|nr:sodium/hydrogen exchanger 3 isoform X3 [Drosophila nasuta]